jgi:ribosomal protein L22
LKIDKFKFNPKNISEILKRIEEEKLQKQLEDLENIEKQYSKEIRKFNNNGIDN